jgi:hypothetical protein
MILLIFASRRARITGMSHRYPGSSLILREVDRWRLVFHNCFELGLDVQANKEPKVESYLTLVTWEAQLSDCWYQMTSRALHGPYLGKKAI